jgi:O-antigen/teichoic acid export membrane protein
MSNLRMVENTFANLCRGGAVALTVILLPPFLARTLSQDAYTTWLLILQLSTYVNLLDLGIQTVIGQSVAYYNELGDIKQRNSIISSAIAILTGSAVVALGGIALIALQLANLFQEMPIALQQDAQLALVLVGGSLALSLPFSVFGAVFLGLYRNDIPAWIIGIGKIFGSILVVLIASSTHNIVLMAAAVGLINLVTGLWQFVAYQKMMESSYQISKKLISSKSLIEIRDSCLALSVSTFGVLIVSGLDTIIIGFFDYKSIAYYALASTLTNFVFGISSAMLNTIVPVASSIGAKNEPGKLGELLISTTKYSVILIIAINLPLLLLSRSVITLWVGASYAEQTSHLFELLIAANFIRQIGSPYFMIAIGCGEHKKIILSPLVEAFTNLFFSIVLTKQIGVNGVAIGTIIGGIASVAMHFSYNLPRTTKIIVRNKLDLIAAITKPIVLIAIPLTALLILVHNQILPPSLWVSILAILIGWGVLWKYGLNQDDRSALLSTIERAVMKKQPE